MKANVPTQGNVADKWERRAGSAGEEYRQGVMTTPRSWATNSKAAEKNYQAGVTAAAGAGRFGKGVDRAGDAKWRANAEQKGPARFSQGVSVAKGAYATGMGPVLDAISSVDLPPRGPAGDQANYSRVSAIGTALRKLKTSR